MEQGNIVLLNGASSAGKSTIARALQDMMEAPYLHTGIDHFLPRLPARLKVVSDGRSTVTTEYFVLAYEGSTTRIVASEEGGESVHADGVLAEVRLGPGAVHLLAGMYQAVAALAAAGVNVIVDDVIHDPRVLRSAVDALHASRVLFVGLHLPREVAEQRERERGDRGPGGAAAFYDKVHAHGLYDLDLDTSVSSPVTCAGLIKEAVLDGRPWSAFAELAARFARETS